MPPEVVHDRFQIKGILGQGGMGTVYRAFDLTLKREVALKTVRDAPDAATLQLFYKECGVLASMTHPNIVEIYDLGQFDEDGATKPYFVMPLLPGETLDKLLRAPIQRLTVERTVDILGQVCRGLQAAHERGLVHRDLKPSNVLVLDDDAVKLIDFGVAHVVASQSTRGQKGTLLYMSPEQILMKPVTPLSDIFSLGVVAYEALTAQHPFRGAREDDVVESVLHRNPPPAFERNPAVGKLLSQVVQKAMAKEPIHRFASAREMGEMLQKALRREPIEIFDPARIHPRVQRANKAFTEGDFQFAGEIVAELEAEGHIDTAITELRQRVDQAVRQRTISQLLDTARARFEADEDPLALQKVQEILQLDPDNIAARRLKSEIEGRRNERQLDKWFGLVRQHLDNNAFAHAREALENALKLDPQDPRALQLQNEIERKSREYEGLRRQKEELYKSALEAWKNAEISTAMTKLGLLLDLDRRAPDTAAPEASTAYQNLYNQVHSAHDEVNNAYAEARRQLVNRNFAQALEVCESCLAKFPRYALFQALRFEIEEQRRQDASARVAEVDHKVEAEPDLQRRLQILSEAVEQFPGEPHFERSLKLAREKYDLVASIVAKANLHEERGQFVEAIDQWEILRTIYSRFPGLDFEVERLDKRREQQRRSETKARVVGEFDTAMQAGDYERALKVLHEAAAEFPNDAELVQLEPRARQALTAAGEAQQRMEVARQAAAQGQAAAALDHLRAAHRLDPGGATVRVALLDALVDRARSLLDRDPSGAEALVQEALEIDAAHPLARSIRSRLLDSKRDQEVAECVAEARRLQATGDLPAALASVERGLSAISFEPRLLQLRDSLSRELGEARRSSTRRHDLDELRQLDRKAETADLPSLTMLCRKIKALSDQYPNDAEFQTVANAANLRHTVLATRVAPSAAPASPRPVEPALAPAAVPSKAASRIAPKPAPGPAAAAAPALAAPPGAPRRAGVWIAATAVAVIVIAAVAAHWALRRPAPAPPAPLTVHASFTLTPPGAALAIDDNAVANGAADLVPGSHQVVATAPGFQPLSRTIAVDAAHERFAFTLAPLAPVLRIAADAASGEVTIDGRRAGALATGLYNGDLLVGTHRVTVSTPNGSLSLRFTVSPAGALSLVGEPRARHARAVVIAASDGAARVRATFAPVAATLDGQPAGTVGRDGLALSQLGTGDHRLGLGSGDSTWNRQFNAASSSLDVYLSSSATAAPTRRVAAVVPKPKPAAKPAPAIAVAQPPAPAPAPTPAEGELDVRVSPANASLTLTRAAAYTRPLGAKRQRLQPGFYDVRANAPGYVPATAAVDLIANKVIRIDIRLLPVMDNWEVFGAKSAAPSLGAPGGAVWRTEGAHYITTAPDFSLYRATPALGRFAFAIKPQGGHQVAWVVDFIDPQNYLLFRLDPKHLVYEQMLAGKKISAPKSTNTRSLGVRPRLGGNKPSLGIKSSLVFGDRGYQIRLDVESNNVLVWGLATDGWLQLQNWKISRLPPGTRNLGAGMFGLDAHGIKPMAIQNFSFTPAHRP